MLGDALRHSLRQEGFTTDWARDAEEAELALATGEYGLLLLDLGLPGKGGLELLAELRKKESPLPVIILTARDAVADRIRGLDGGADDYLVKPFDADELAARIRALQRRQAGRAAPLVSHGPLLLNPATRELFCDGERVTLSAREYVILAALMERPGALLSRTALEERLYGWGEEVESNAVEVHIHNLRKKIGAGQIRTVRGVGYMLAGAP
ncbi:DNA-binding response regulator [Geotalea uraniireducens]|uniref:DNA-binding response regulator n=2 Tax=Geotalea uraniireducens TaxID=351604 RepID=A0ABN6VPF1_9BACT|nr:DNA-binding response regulator [Geotalea uraniireducens]